MKSFFINEAVTKAITDYLSSKSKPEGVLYNSFLVVVIRMLVNIYGELDIINPFQVKNEAAFDNNLMKFGATEEEIANFKRLLDGFYVIELRNIKSIRKEDNNYFIEVQKCLIDLFTLKRINFGLTESDYKEFFDLLYTPGTSNYLRQSYNFLNTDESNRYEIAEYYKKCLEIKKLKNKEDDMVADTDKDLLGFDVYKLFNFSVADISKMNKDEVDKLNKEIYESLEINENAINKEYLLNEKVKRFKLNEQPITTGNGYVDILLIMSVIVTTLMVVVIFGTLVF